MSEQIKDIKNFDSEFYSQSENIDTNRLDELKEGADKAISRAREYIDKKHKNKPYHKNAHTRAVTNTAKAFTKNFVSEDEKVSAIHQALLDSQTEYAGAFHDTELLATQAESGKPKFTNRDRGWRSDDCEWEGGNEYRSFLLGVRFMLEEFKVLEDTYLTNEEVYKKHQELKEIDSTYKLFMDGVEDGVRVTVPTGNFDEFPVETDFKVSSEYGYFDVSPYIKMLDGTFKGLKIDQPELLNPKVPPPASLTGLSIATGDLMLCGYAKDEQRFFTVGDREMLEGKYQLAIDLDKVLKGELDDEGRFAELVSEVGDWIKGQVGFVLWQKLRAKEISEKHPALKNNPERKRQYLDGLPYFDKNMVAAAKRSDDFGAYKENLLEGSITERAQYLLNFLSLGEEPGAVVGAARKEGEQLPLHPDDK